MQSKRRSLNETLVNTGVGLLGSWIITMVILFWIQDKWTAGTLTVVMCTMWSLIRGFTIRRIFNANDGLEEIAEKLIRERRLAELFQQLYDAHGRVYYEDNHWENINQISEAWQSVVDINSAKYKPLP